MIFNIIPDSTQYRYRLSSTQIGKFDLWSFQMTPSAALPTQQQFPEIVNYVSPDYDQTMVSSFSCSDKVITVGEHKNRMTYMDCTNNLFVSTTNYTPGALAPQSSHGPTRDARLKPEICASGGMSLAAGAYNVLPNLPVTSKALGCMHIRDGGTSTASPVVAGIDALILQRYPNASWQDIKNCITQNAMLDSLVTGTIPNNSWGYGRADGFAAMLGCSFLAINEYDSQVGSIYPIPFNQSFQIAAVKQLSAVKIFNPLGQLVYQTSFNIKTAQKITVAPSLPVKGVYFAQLISTDGYKQTIKLIYQ